MATETSLDHCRWCDGGWPKISGFKLSGHERKCALSIECPRCGAQPKVRCWYPSGQTITQGAHSAREKVAIAAGGD